MNTLSKCLLVLALTAFSSLATMAQDEKTTIEFFGGYSWLNTDTGIDEIDPLLEGTFGSHGVEFSLTGNVHRYVGIKGDFSHHSKSRRFTDGTDFLDVNVRTTQFLGGLQFKDNLVDGSRWRPFAHVLAGVAHTSVGASGIITEAGRPLGLGTPIDEETSANNFAMALGGGLDIKVHRHVSIRAIQADYNPIFFRDQNIGEVTIPGQTQNNFRISFGVVVHN